MPIRPALVGTSHAIQECRVGDVEREKRWIEAVRRGDIPAFEAVFHEYYNALCLYASGFAENNDTAEEIVAEVFARLWEHRERWDVRTSLRNYLFSAVRNHSLNYVRDRRNRDRLHATFGNSEASPGMGRLPATPEEEAYAGALHDLVVETIAALPERSREAFLLSRRHGLSHAEIAKVMRISVSTVEKHVLRATRAIADRVAEWMADA